MSLIETLEQKIEALESERDELFKQLDGLMVDIFDELPVFLSDNAERIVRSQFSQNSEKTKRMDSFLIGEFKKEFESVKAGISDTLQSILNSPEAVFDHHKPELRPGSASKVDHYKWYPNTVKSGFIADAIEQSLEPINTCVMDHGLFDSLSQKPVKNPGYWAVEGAGSKKYQEVWKKYHAILEQIDSDTGLLERARAEDMWDKA